MEDQIVATKRRRNESGTESSTATDEDDLTSENNKRVREQSRKIFVELKKRVIKAERGVCRWGERRRSINYIVLRNLERHERVGEDNLPKNNGAAGWDG